VIRHAVPAVLVLVLAACGGSSDDDDEAAAAQQAVRDFVEATNARDGDRLCGELLTEEYKEQASGAVGEAAERSCRRQLELTTGLTLGVVSIGRTTVDGERATVRAVLDTDGVQAPRLFRLEKEDGSWKLASGESG
jgi:hypothetical protein